nr:WYL domain-containing protein [Lachnospiraceae bacterium]
GGEEVRVKLLFEDSMVGVLLDRFGKDISIYRAKKKGWSETSVDVALSDQFLGWIFSLGTRVKIAGPDEVVERFHNEIKNLNKLYQRKDE